MTTDQTQSVEQSQAVQRALQAASAHLSPEQAASWPEERRAFLEGLAELSKGQLEAAAQAFRRAGRKSEPPFGGLAQLALGECERLRGKEGMALKVWKALAQDAQAERSTRRMAWLSIAALEERRGDERALGEAKAALEALGPEDHGPATG